MRQVIENGFPEVWADLGFVCQAKSFQRLREGFYGQDAKPVRIQTHEPVSPELHAQRLNHYRQTGEWREAWGPKPREAA